MSTSEKENIANLADIDYSENPQEFDALAEKIIEDFINSLPKEKQLKLRQIQFRIKGSLAKYPTPLGRWQAMQDIFIREVFEEEEGFVKTMAKIGGHKS